MLCLYTGNTRPWLQVTSDNHRCVNTGTHRSRQACYSGDSSASWRENSSDGRRQKLRIRQQTIVKWATDLRKVTTGRGILNLHTVPLLFGCTRYQHWRTCTGPIGTALHRSSPCWRIAILLKRVPRGDKNYGGYSAQKWSPKTANVSQNTPTTLWNKCKPFSYLEGCQMQRIKEMIFFLT